MKRLCLCVLPVIVAASAPALAAEPTGCDGFKWKIDREQSAFATPGLPFLSPGGEIPGVMDAVTLKLDRQDGQSFPVAPVHKPRNTPAYAGTFKLMFTQVPGPYNITLSDAAFIDVVQNGKLLKQTGYTGATGCANVRKSVRFDIGQGPATVMITDAPTDSLKLEVLPPPVK